MAGVLAWTKVPVISAPVADSITPVVGIEPNTRATIFNVVAILGMWGWELVAGDFTATSQSDRCWIFKRPIS